MKIVAKIHTDFKTKFGIPRQSGLVKELKGRIVFEPEYSVKEALRGIEGYSHLWLLWGFHQDRFTDRIQTTSLTEDRPAAKEWSPTVRPPRLGGNTRMGVFATRSPFRPNPIGLSSVQLLKVESRKIKGESHLALLVSGADLLDGTPIYDIKPYLSFSDSHEDAKNGFADSAKEHKLEVVGLPSPSNCLRNLSESIPKQVVEDISYILSQDPRPGYQDDSTREYKMDYSGYTVTFVVENGTAIVKNIEKT